MAAFKKPVSSPMNNMKRIFLSERRHRSVIAGDTRTNYCVKSTKIPHSFFCSLKLKVKNSQF